MKRFNLIQNLRKLVKLKFSSLDVFQRVFTLLLFLLERWKWKTNTSLSDYRTVGPAACRTNGLSDYSYAPVSVLGDFDLILYFTLREYYTERGSFKIHYVKQSLIALMFGFSPTSIIQVKTATPPFSYRQLRNHIMVSHAILWDKLKVIN